MPPSTWLKKERVVVVIMENSREKTINGFKKVNAFILIKCSFLNEDSHGSLRTK